MVYVVLPRKRIDAAALQGEIDLRCYISPGFVDNPDHYVWSPGLFEISDVLFGAGSTLCVGASEAGRYDWLGKCPPENDCGTHALWRERFDCAELVRKRNRIPRVCVLATGDFTADTGRLIKALEALKKANQFEEICAVANSHCNPHHLA